MFDSRANPQSVKIQYIYQQLVETKWINFLVDGGFEILRLNLLKRIVSTKL